MAETSTDRLSKELNIKLVRPIVFRARMLNYVIIAISLFFLAIISYFSEWSDGINPSIAASICLFLGISIILIGLASRLTFTDTVLIKQTILGRQQIAYKDIAALHHRMRRVRSRYIIYGTTALYILESRQGSRIRLIPFNYHKGQSLCAALLQLVHHYKIVTDSRTQELLGKDSRNDRWHNNT